MAKKEKRIVLKGDEEVELTIDTKESTKAKKIFKGKDKDGHEIKHIEMNMMIRDKEAK